MSGPAPVARRPETAPPLTAARECLALSNRCAPRAPAPSSAGGGGGGSGRGAGARTDAQAPAIPASVSPFPRGRPGRSRQIPTLPGGAGPRPGRGESPGVRGTQPGSGQPRGLWTGRGPARHSAPRDRGSPSPAPREETGRRNAPLLML